MHETHMTHSEAGAKLDAYLDGALAAELRWAVAEHLSACPECQRYAGERARLREIVRGHAAAIEPPAELHDRLRSALAAQADGPPTLAPVTPFPLQAARVAAVVGPLAAGLLLLLWVAGMRPAETPQLFTELLVAHALFAQDTSKLDVAGDAATVEAWFRSEAGLSVAVPEIPGYRFAGGRLATYDGQPVAQLVYRSDAEGLYLSLLRFKDQDANVDGAEVRDGYAVAEEGPTTFVTWATGEDRTVLIGESPPAEIEQVARELAPRLEPLPTPAPVEIRVVPGSSPGMWGDYP
jgi:anti-sigma factor RsiW